MILLIVVLIAFLALWAVIQFWTRWYLTRTVAREAEEAAKAGPRPEPESRIVPQVTEEEVPSDRTDADTQPVSGNEPGEGDEGSRGRGGAG